MDLLMPMAPETRGPLIEYQTTASNIQCQDPLGWKSAPSQARVSNLLTSYLLTSSLSLWLQKNLCPMTIQPRLRLPPATGHIPFSMGTFHHVSDIKF